MLGFKAPADVLSKKYYGIYNPLLSIHIPFTEVPSKVIFIFVIV